jgi:alpha-tubulin suppressor-like RCC1 family protein
MSLNFPSAPNLNDTYTLGPRTWRFNGNGWEVVPTPGPIGFTGSQGSSIGGGVTAYATIAELPLSGNDSGDLAFVEQNNRLYIWNNVGWFNIALINTNPTITQGPDSSYVFLTDGTPIVVTLTATDPEGIPITWSYQVTTGTLGDTATIEQNDNVFTFTPSTDKGDSGTFSVTFTASDGVNIATAVSSFSLVFADKFSVWAWGRNSGGRLGDGTTVNKSSPISVIGGFTDWCQVSAGFEHSLGVRCNGTTWAWGSNTNGRLGDGTTVARTSPVSVVGGFTDWCQVSAGYSHSLGVRCNGTAWAWGVNGLGRLGDNTITDRSSPVSVVGGFTDWRQVSGGWCHSLGVRTNGTLWTWGCNNYGQLGDNTTTNRSSPVLVAGGFTDWCQVSGGWCHSLGVRCNGTAWAWGGNCRGRLGDNTTINRSSPVLVAGGFTDWCQVSGGSDHSLGVRCNGTAWAWGCNGQGRLGNGNEVNQTSPVSVIGGFSDWCQVSGSRYYSLGVRCNGTVWAWGFNSFGRLGDNTTVSKSSPVLVAGGFTDWCQVSAGDAHSLAIRKLPE